MQNSHLGFQYERATPLSESVSNYRENGFCLPATEPQTAFLVDRDPNIARSLRESVRECRLTVMNTVMVSRAPQTASGTD